MNETAEELRRLELRVATGVFGYRHLVGEEVPEEHWHRGDRVTHQEVWLSPDGKDRWCRWCGDPPQFTDGAQHTASVIERMRELGYRGQIDIRPGDFAARFVHPEVFVLDEVPWHIAETLGSAICKAALAALGVTP